MRSRTMPPSGIQIYFQPHVTLTFDLMYPSCDIMGNGIYHTMCLPGLAKMQFLRNLTEKKFL